MRDLETRVTTSDALHLLLSPKDKDNSAELDTILCHHYILNVLKEPCLLSTVLFFTIETLYFPFGRKTSILNCNFFGKLLSGIKRTQGKGCPPSLYVQDLLERCLSAIPPCFSTLNNLFCNETLKNLEVPIITKVYASALIQKQINVVS